MRHVPFSCCGEIVDCAKAVIKSAMDERRFEIARTFAVFQSFFPKKRTAAAMARSIPPDTM